MNVVFCASEAVPFIKTGGLADVVGALPLALEKQGVKVCLFLPFYKSIEEQNIDFVNRSGRYNEAKIGSHVRVFFIKNEKYYDRPGAYGDEGGDYEDNLERFKFYSLSVLELLKDLKIQPDVIHCHDWHAALIPLYKKELFGADPFFNKTKTVFTIHNLAYQGVFKKEEYSKLNLPEHLFNMDLIEYYDQVNLMKAAIISSDHITTVSSNYAKEIMTDEFGCGLNGVLKYKAKNVSGVLNGLDYNLWNPKTDPFIHMNYDKDSFSQGKRVNKRFLQEALNVNVSDRPMFGFVGRLSHQKGVDLIIEAAEQLLKYDLQLVIQGVGDPKYKEELLDLREKYSDRLVFAQKFDEPIAHLIYASSDFYLMPSIFEPCGIGQMIALSYGAIPIVSPIGGLVDTIHHIGHVQMNGIHLHEISAHAIIKACVEAIEIYDSEDLMNQLISNAFNSEFSWDEAATEYKRIYSCA